MLRIARNLLIIAVAAMATAGTAAATEIYRWVDEDGNVHYGDVPEDSRAEEVPVESQPTDPARVRAQTESVAALRENLAERAQARDEAEAEREKARAEREQREQQCADARERLRKALESRRMYKLDENGERVYYEDEDYDRIRAEAQELVEERCSN